MIHPTDKMYNAIILERVNTRAEWGETISNEGDPIHKQSPRNKNIHTHIERNQRMSKWAAKK